MYLEIDEGYFEHPKTLDLCARLNDSKACVYPLRLWKWACRSAKSGKLGKISAFAMEKAMDYEPMDGRCFEAMCLSGFVDRHDDGTCEIHDWMGFTGGALKRMEDKAAENKKRREEGKKRYEAEQSKQRTGIVPVQSENHTGRNLTQTRQDKTRQDQTSKEGPAPARSNDDANESEPVRPRDPHSLECCLGVAVRREQPQLGYWLPGRFSYNDAQQMLAQLGDIEAALPVIERKIELFAKDPDMQPWTMAKFVDKFNAIGLPKLEFGRAPKAAAAITSTPIRTW